MPRKPKRSRFLPLVRTGQRTLTREQATQEFWNSLTRFKENCRRSIEERGWRILEPAEGEGCDLVRTHPDADLYIAGVLKIPKGETVNLVESYDPATSTDSKLEFSKQEFELLSSFEKAAARGDLKAVAHWAFLVGLVRGRSNVMFHESLAGARNIRKRTRKKQVTDSDYLNAIKAAGGARVRTKTILEKLDPGLFDSAKQTAHYERIARLKKTLPGKIAPGK